MGFISFVKLIFYLTLLIEFAFTHLLFSSNVLPYQLPIYSNQAFYHPILRVLLPKHSQYIGWFKNFAFSFSINQIP